MKKNHTVEGTVFQRSVWKAVEQIPQGRVTTYGAIARFLNTKGVRAVGSAVGKNPDAPRVPCHRVVRSDGTIGAYSGSGGRDGKIDLLRKEGIQIENERIADLESVFFDAFQ